MKTDYAILQLRWQYLEAGQTDWGYERFFMEMALTPI